jgi:xaa-pro dipeptidase
MSDFYLTIKDKSEGLYKEKMSKFISFAIPVETADEAKEIIKSYQKEYFDARHVCWAYMIGAARTEYMSNDNGEPSGTAGKPILGQINSFNLTNILIIVVRYFGGIKLGTSGLIVAYREAALDAINNAEITECHEMVQITFTFPYLAMNDVMKIIKKDDITIISQDFDNLCRMKISIRADYAPAITKAIDGIGGTSVSDPL